MAVKTPVAKNFVLVAGYDGTFKSTDPTGIRPANTVLPTISGTLNPGQTLTISNGTWYGTGNSYTYQWKNGGVNIGGATASTFAVPSSGYFGAVITCTVTATNAGGTATATTAGSTIVAAPVNTVAPSVSGTATINNVQTCASGTWTGHPTITYTYQWQENTGSWGNISGQTASTYTPTTAGDYRCVVTGTNSEGASSANTATVTITTGVQITEDFAGTVGNTIDSRTTNSGATWTRSGSGAQTIVIATGNVGTSSGSPSGRVLYLPDVTPNSKDQTISCTMVVDNTGKVSIGLVARATDANNFYIAYRQSGTWAIGQYVASTFTTLATYTGGAGTFAVEFIVTDAAKILKIDGTTQINYTATNALTAVGKMGLGIVFADATYCPMDNYSATS